MSLIDGVVSNVTIAAALALIAVLVGRVAVKPQIRHTLWVLVLVKLVTPPLVHIHVPFTISQPTTSEASAGSNRSVEPEQLSTAKGEAQHETDGAHRSQTSYTTPVPSNEAETNHRMASAWAPAVSWWGVFSGVWLAGTITWYLLAVTRLFRFRKMLRYACPASAEVQAEVHDIGSRFALRNIPRVLVVEANVPPLIWSFGRKPSMVLPAGFLSKLRTKERAGLLAHELAHLKRCDHWIRWFELFVLGIYWWNPIAWWARAQVQQAEEECCDRWVLWAFPDHATQYAQTLVDTVEFLAVGPELKLDIATAFSQGNSLQRRIEMILGPSVSRRLSWKVKAVLVLLALVVTPLSLTAQGGGNNESEAAQKNTSKRSSGSPSPESTTDEAVSTDAAQEAEYTFPITVQGRATDEHGNAIEGAVIYLAAHGPAYRRLSQTKTDSSGSYRFDDILLPIERPDTNEGRDVGSFEVFGTANEYALAWRPRKAFFPDTPHEKEPNWEHPEKHDLPTRYGRDDPIKLDLTFGSPRSIRGRIVDDTGQPIPDTALTIRYCDTEWQQDDYGVSTFQGSLDSLNSRQIVPLSVKARSTGPDGRFEFTNLPADHRWSIEIRPPGHPSRRIWAVTRNGIDSDAKGNRVYSGDFEVIFSRPRTVRLRVVYGDTGEPAPKVGVGGIVTVAGFWETTDEEGVVETLLPDGEYKLGILPRYGTPYLKTTSDLVVSADTTQQTTTIRLRPAAVVDITVVDADTGDPLSGVDVWLDGQPGYGYRSWSWEVETRISHYERPRSDKNGRMRVLFEPGNHRIGVGRDAYPEGYTPLEPAGREIECQPGEPVAVTFRMKKDGPIQANDAANARVLAVNPSSKMVVIQWLGADVPSPGTVLGAYPTSSLRHQEEPKAHLEVLATVDSLVEARLMVPVQTIIVGDQLRLVPM